MKWRIDWAAADSAPAREAVLRSQGLPEGPGLPPRIGMLLDEAIQLYVRLAAPRALVGEIDEASFAAVFRGDGRNDAETALAAVYPRAATLALFTATVGAPVSEAITDLFAQQEPALAFMLDAVASEAADALGFAAGRDVLARLRADGRLADDARVLPYSPGYCGWHVTGQRALFAALRPEAIGVTLNDSCMMQPLKSVSGVLVVAPAAAHQFSPDFACCGPCTTHNCQERLLKVLEP